MVITRTFRQSAQIRLYKSVLYEESIREPVCACSSLGRYRKVYLPRSSTHIYVVKYHYTHAQQQTTYGDARTRSHFQPWCFVIDLPKGGRAVGGGGGGRTVYTLIITSSSSSLCVYARKSRWLPVGCESNGCSGWRSGQNEDVTRTLTVRLL